MVVHGILSEFADEASFLWFLRARAVNEPHYTLDDLARLDGRLEAHLDGLRVAGQAGWERCKDRFGSSNPADYFAPSVLAFERGVPDHIKAVLDAINNDPLKATATISALGWMTYGEAEPHITRLLASQSTFHRYIGIAASAVHRQDPGACLDRTLADTDLLLVTRALRAYGELGRTIRLNDFGLRSNLDDGDEGIRFSTAWTAALMGNSAAVEVLGRFVQPESPHGEIALNMALRRMEPAAAFSWQRHLAESSHTIRFAVIGAGIIGDPVLVPWLLEQMKTPALARIAGEAFTMITGADLEQEALGGLPVAGCEGGPNDDPLDSNVAMDADDNLTWPDVEAVVHWWKTNKGNFPDGIRNILGAPISGNQLRHVLKAGYQRQRAAAALELAILEPGQPLFEVRAPGGRQHELLRQMAAV